MEKSFFIRVDVESRKGIIEGLPKLLDLFKELRVKGSFYLVMGGESGLFDILRYRKTLPHAGERKIKIFSVFEKIRMLLLPKDFASENLDIIKRILVEGHELGIHGWKHRAWTRGFDEINKEEHIKLAVDYYRNYFGKTPISSSAPGFNNNKEVLTILYNNGIRYVSDFSGKGVRLIKKIKNVPITINGENNMPIIEFLAGSGKTDKEILDYIKKCISKNEITSFYIHDLYEARQKIDLLRSIIKHLKGRGIKNRRIIDY